MATFMAGLLGSKALLPWRVALPLLGAGLLAGPLPVLAQQPAPGDAPASELPSSEMVDSPAVDTPSAEPAAEAPEEPRVQIAEVTIEGLDSHPERERLELAAYNAMAVTPGRRVTRSELQADLSAVYATGWFSDVRIQPVDGPLGVLQGCNPVVIQSLQSMAEFVFAVSRRFLHPANQDRP